MSCVASERSFIVRAPSITAPPCGLCLNQQPDSLSMVEMVPWIRIILSKSYFKQYFMPLLLISLLHIQKGSFLTEFSSTSFFLLHFLFSSPSPLPSQTDWLSSSRLLHNAGHFQFSSCSFKRAPLCLSPTPLPPQPPHTPRLSLWGV